MAILNTATQKQLVLSANHLKRWSRCQKQFNYSYISKLAWPQDQSNFRLGRDVHKLLDYQARGLDCSLLLRDAEGDVCRCFELLMAHPSTQWPILGNEWGFDVPVSKSRLTGRMDRIAQDGEQVVVIDWKTGTGTPKQPETDWQTVVYLAVTLLCARELGLENLTPEQLRFDYVEVKDAVRVTSIAYNASLHAQFWQRVEATIQQIERAESYALPKFCPDRWCQYRNVCGIEQLQQT